MQIIKPNSNFDFVSKNRIAVIVSVVVILAGLLSLTLKGGPQYGVDFSGGTLIQVRFSIPMQAAQIKDGLAGLDLGPLTVQQFGDTTNEFLIRAQKVEEQATQFSQKIEQTLKNRTGDEQLDILRSEMVGPQVGKDLRSKGLLSLLYAMLGTLVYISWRFEYRYGVAAMVALGHDVLVTLGLFSLFDKEIDLTIVAAFLTIIGYSLNDTIIIFDRLRENIGRHGGETFPQTVNRSINETLSRTILTSGTTLLVVVALFAFGGGVIHNFAFALLVGIVAGTYSTVFVASALILFWEKHRPVLTRAPRPAGEKP
ncbi:protein translocase subunit SecF [Trichloromonas sp.]|uniref:protein translocase subunit SecF n=1 Tax=Trichloromonas sp. TaxID=3069249 RepID=UPI003D817588